MELLTLSETAATLGVAKITLRRWTKAGILPCIRVGSRQDRRFRAEDVAKIVLKGTPENDKNGGS